MKMMGEGAKDVQVLFVGDTGVVDDAKRLPFFFLPDTGNGGPTNRIFSLLPRSCLKIVSVAIAAVTAWWPGLDWTRQRAMRKVPFIVARRDD